MGHKKPTPIPPGLPTSPPPPRVQHRVSEDDRRLAQNLVDQINRKLRKWEAWFPDPESEVSVPRNELLALKLFAEIGLSEHFTDWSDA
jgi:hypothetical protein